MTNIEAINTLKDMKKYFNDPCSDKYYGFDDNDNVSIDAAINALEMIDEIGEYMLFSDFVVATCSSFARCSGDKADDIIEELLNHKSKYPKLNMLWDQYCGNFS